MTTPSPDFPRYAAVELGSSSFRLHVGRVERGELHLEASLCEPVALAASFGEDGSLCEAALRHALACLRGYAQVLDSWHPQAVRVVATSALGFPNAMARNAALFLAAAETALRRPIELIAGDEAGRLVYLGVASTLGDDDGLRLVLDIGSASTELVLGRGPVIERIESFAVGAVRQGLSFFAGGRIDAAGFDAAVRSGRSRFAGTTVAGHHPTLAHGACGTVRALAGIAIEDGIAGGHLTLECLDELRRRFIEAGDAARLGRAWAPAAQAPHLAGGLALLIALMQECGIAETAPVHAGLRVGALWDLHRGSVAVRPRLPPGASRA